MTGFSVPVIHLAETDSTNNYLNRLSLEENPEEFTVVTAGFQTAGKGQWGNGWESEAGKNLLFSIVMYPDFLEARKQFLLSQAVSLAVKEALDTFAEGFSIKWPNDIYHYEKKVCGMLIENDLVGNAIKKSVAGIGINVNQEQFRSPAPNPVSLWQITGKPQHMDRLLRQVIDRIIENYTLLKEGKADLLTARYHDALFRKEGLFPYRDSSGDFMARIVCVKPEGTLMLKDGNGNERGYMFKEVQFCIGL
ncbi:MAG: biotin--[acetyl-CoA-carboxylase] ligase [Mediterranea sp.]|jgi:BirA family biotin operon repressor/biotin-[acetyl-CoA-carboxylase] ligase|nr:biotin--[acetyl-CoA-carboxylase] ligase [Mediterranea sp.]